VVSEHERWGIDGFQLGLALGGASAPAEWARDVALVERAEALGLHSVWVPEMHFGRGVTASPLVALAGFAARTERIRLATTSLLLPIHEPLRLADEISALDRASRGRTIIGLGRGFSRPLFRAFGIDPKTKRDRFDAALDTMLDAWRDGADGRVRSPWQQPHPPLAVAAFGPKGLAQAARRALPYLPSPLESPRRLAENIARWREGLPAGTDASHSVVPLMRTLHVAGDETEAASVLAALESQERTLRSSGAHTPRPIADAAKENLRDRVVVGTVTEVIDRVGALREELGIDLLVVRAQLPGGENEMRDDALLRLAEEVWPALR
jgi:alkanesulfonate monooxygenase SsuD/methylene tetrahydromethanopterin reductase-like flavin-dependent oxidoreductase (luciferase family)